MAQSRFVINLGSNLLNFGIGIIIGFFFTPYLIRHLGVACYGLIPLVGTFATFLGLITVAINAPLGRFLTIALARKEFDQANRIFNSALWAVLTILALALLPLLLFCWKGLGWLNVPPGMEFQFSVLASCAVAMFCMNAVGSIFGTSAYCCNRLELSSMVNFTSNVLRVLIVVVLFTFFLPAVWMIGLGMFIAGTSTVVLFIATWRRLTPQLKVSRQSFCKDTLRQLVGLGGWSVVNQLGIVLFLSIDLFVVNRLLGPDASGRYGAVMTFSTLLRNTAGVLAGVFGPTIVTLYAKKQTEQLLAYSRRSVKFVGLAMSLPIALICGFSRPLLGTWLGPDFESLSPLMSLMTIHLCVNLAVMPLGNIQLATGHVRWPGILTCAAGVLNLGLAICLAGPAGFGMYGVAMAGAILLTIKNGIFFPIYTARLLRVPMFAFVKEMAIIALTTVLLSAAAWGLTQSIPLHGWIRLAAASAFLTLVWAGLSYLILLNREERALLRNMIPGLPSASPVTPKAN